MRIQISKRLNIQVDKLGFDDHYKHPLMMVLNVNKSQASSLGIFKKVHI